MIYFLYKGGVSLGGLDNRSKIDNINKALRFTTVYTIISLIIMYFSGAIKLWLEKMMAIGTLSLANVYVINLSLKGTLVFFMSYGVLYKYSKDRITIEDNLKELKTKSNILEKLNKEIKGQKQLIFDVLDSADIVVIRLDENFNILSTSYNIESVVSFSQEDVFKKNLSTIMAEKYINVIKSNLEISEEYSLDLDIVTKHGKTIYMNVTAKRHDSNDTKYVVVLHDISERRILEQKITFLDSYDSVTALPNRKLLEEAFGFLSKKTNGRNNLLAFLYIDIDNFSYINEVLGHDAGDHLLMEIADKLKCILKPKDILSRIVQDKFAIILTDENSIEDINKKIVEILKTTKMNWRYGDSEYLISTTAGVSLYPKDGRDFITLLKNTNTALECAKENYRGGYDYYSPENKSVATRDLSMLADIRLAIINKEFEMYYQPIVNLATGEIESVESLIRWFHPKKGYIPPNEFIPMAEKAGIIDEIGDYVLEEVFSQKKRWGDHGYHLKKVAINISAISFNKVKFADRIKEKLRRHGLEGGEIILELTETGFSSGRNRIKKNIEGLRCLGVEISMDDFGTGYSSLARLKDLPIDYIKLDRTFISDLIGGEDQELIKPLISLADALGQRVIAEGIETEEQYDILKRLGCTFGQGYFLARPMPAKELEQTLRLCILDEELISS